MKVNEKKMGRVDLHLHSIYSDGMLSPKELVKRAKEVGLSAISLTDHDNVSGIDEALRYGPKYGIEVIPGVELSTSEQGLDTHILGYFIDKDNSSLKRHLEFFRQHRIKRAKKIVENLNTMGCRITFEQVKKKSISENIGRPHIADAMVECGFVHTLDEAFYKFLGDNKAAFVPKYKIGTLDAILMIKNAGGLSFLAHPSCDLPEKLIIEFIKRGLNGIEVLHPRHSQRDIDYFRAIIKQYNILESGGSDYHSEQGNQAQIGEYVLPYQIVTKMRTYLSTRDIDAARNSKSHTE